MRPFFAFSLLALLGCPPAPDQDSGKDTAPVGPADEDGDGHDVETDCDDTDAAVFPGADELCNGADDDCDGAVDEEPTDPRAWYADADLDGYGDPAARRTACEAPAGYVADASDCNDASSDYHPGAPETGCAGPDYNCNGTYDEGDGDGDGYLACDDCDDTRDDVNPDAAEACDGLDNDCNGTIDDGAGDSSTFYADLDGDLYGDADSPVEACALPPGYSETRNDCDDLEATVHPGADETCNGVDDDCDDEADEDPVDPELFYRDADNDGYGNASVTIADCEAPVGYTDDATDCNDGSGSIHPGAAEYCGTTDHDCDGLTDEADSVDVIDYYTDDDGDGYFGTWAGAACSAPSGTNFAYTDCDDGDTTINPAADDVCNDVDDDCDGDVDDGKRVPEDYSTIQSAILAARAGEHVCVAAGTYYENVSFYGRGVLLEGEDGSAVTTIYGTGSGSVVTISSGEVDPELRGFTITGGDTNSGAGMYVYGVDLVMDDVVVTGNSCSYAYCYGVGGYFYSSDVVATDVEFSDNAGQPAIGTGSYVYVSGAGLYVGDSTGSWDGLTISGNSAYLYGFTSSSHYGYAYGVGAYLLSNVLTLSDVRIEDNWAYRPSSSYGYAQTYGTGAYINTNSLTVDGLEVYSNTTQLYGSSDFSAGGGLYLYQDTSSFDHLDIRGNSVDAYNSYAAGVEFGYSSSSTVDNSVIAGNKSYYSVTGYNYIWAVGMLVDQYAVPVLTNVDIYGNKGTAEYVYGAGILLDYYAGIDATNISVSGNSMSASYGAYGGAVYLYSTSYSSGYSFTYSNFYGNSSQEFTNLSTPVGGSGNIAVTPGYTSVSSSDPEAWDFTLTSSSSMRNVGDPSLLDTDGTRSDIGSHGGPAGW